MTTRTDTEARSARGPRFDPADVRAALARAVGGGRACIAPTTRTRAQKHYLLTMYPYPSGDLHIGHWYAATGPDIVARMRRMQGLNVMFPMGFDSFGLPAENAAIDRGIHPASWTDANIERMRAQFRSMGCMFDWSREVVVSDPRYYRWTQWLFLQFYQRRAGVSGHGAGRLVPEGPGGAGPRAGGGGRSALLALRHAGHQARPGAVVLPHHQLRGRAARLQQAWTGRSRSG